MLQGKKKLLVLFCLTVVITILVNCTGTGSLSNDPRGEEYAGSATCFNCHREIYTSYTATAHARTSSLPSSQTILGSFHKDSNAVVYRPTVKVMMEERDSGFYQAAYLDGEKKQEARFDMVIGSGRKGQSYLSWLDSSLYQLPVSYFAPAKAWVNSPGYPAKFVLFNRNTPVGCFDCHSSYINNTGFHTFQGYRIDHFDKATIIYGIDCERCHGPLAAHVNHQEKNPEEKTAKFVTRLASLQRQQQLDMCAVCHSGADHAAASSFAYQPGDQKEKFLAPENAAVPLDQVDVHGKQYQLLSASQCFIKSQSLTCGTCHNPHTAGNNLQSITSKCMGCHASPKHVSPQFAHMNRSELTANCINCHMPTKPSRVINMKTVSQADSIAAMIRTHYISIYRDL